MKSSYRTAEQKSNEVILSRTLRDIAAGTVKKIVVGPGLGVVHRGNIVSIFLTGSVGGNPTAKARWEPYNGA